MTLTVTEVLLLSLNCLVLLLLCVLIFGKSSALAVFGHLLKSLDIGSFSDVMSVLQKYKSGEKIENDAEALKKVLDQLQQR